MPELTQSGQIGTKAQQPTSSSSIRLNNMPPETLDSILSSVYEAETQSRDQCHCSRPKTSYTTAREICLEHRVVNTMTLRSVCRAFHSWDINETLRSRIVTDNPGEKSKSTSPNLLQACLDLAVQIYYENQLLYTELLKSLDNRPLSKLHIPLTAIFDLLAQPEHQKTVTSLTHGAHTIIFRELYDHTYVQHDETRSLLAISGFSPDYWNQKGLGRFVTS